MSTCQNRFCCYFTTPEPSLLCCMHTAFVCESLLGCAVRTQMQALPCVLFRSKSRNPGMWRPVNALPREIVVCGSSMLTTEQSNYTCFQSMLHAPGTL